MLEGQHAGHAFFMASITEVSWRTMSWAPVGNKTGRGGQVGGALHVLGILLKNCLEAV